MYEYILEAEEDFSLPKSLSSMWCLTAIVLMFWNQWMIANIQFRTFYYPVFYLKT